MPSSRTCFDRRLPRTRWAGRGAAAVLALTLAAAPRATAQDDRAPTLDQVSVQDREGFVDAVGRIANGDERAGIATLESIAKQFGGDPDLYILHYNVACGRARLKEVEPAFTQLTLAIDLGYAIDPRQLENLRRDPDLEPLRGDPRFAALLERAKRRNDELMARLPELLAPFSWAPPAPAEGEAKPRPLLIVLHPFGSEREAFARANFLEFCRKHDFALLAPAGEFLISPGHFSWFRGEGDFIDRFRRAARRVWFALEEMKKRTAIDPQQIHVVGQGEGASLGFAVAVRNPQWVRGAVLFGGGYSPTSLEGWEAAAPKWGRRIALVHGKNDAVYPIAPLPPFVLDLQKKGLSLELTVVDGGHDLPGSQVLEPLLLERLSWIDASPWTASAPAAPATGGH